MQSPFFLITIMFQMGINKKINFNKYFARKYIKAYTNSQHFASASQVIENLGNACNQPLMRYFKIKFSTLKLVSRYRDPQVTTYHLQI